LSKGQVFLRDATGLVREIGPIDAVVLAIGGIIGPTWIIGFASEWFLFPGVNVAASFAIMGVLGAVHGMYYVLITSAMPRSGGGGYVPLSRVIHPAFGLGMSFLMIAAYTLNLSLVASFLTSVGIFTPLTTYGTLTGNTALVSFVSTFSSSTWTFVTGTVTVLIVGLIAIAGTKAIISINKIAIAVGSLGFVIMIGILIGTTPQTFAPLYNSYAGSPNAYQNMITLAQNAGMANPSNWVPPTLLSLPVTFFLITGYQIGTYYSGELKRVQKTMALSVIGSILYGACVFSLVAFLMTQAFGGDFIKSAVYLYNAAPSQYPLTVAPWVSSFIVLLNNNLFVNAILIASYVAFGYLLMIGFVFIGSRHFLAWSFDRSFPSALGKVSDRFHSPVTAIVLISVLAEIGLGLYVYLPTIMGPVNLTFLFVAAWMFDGLAGIALPFRSKSIFERGLPILRKKIAGVPLIVISGAYDVVLLILLFIASLYNPAAVGPLGFVTLATIFGSFILGVLMYYGMKAYNAKNGIDIALVFKEIPPE